MKTKTQDPKFYIENDRLFGQSGLVPDDEPLFILRARDVNAVDTLQAYYSFARERGANKEHLGAVESRIKQFSEFARNPTRMKLPDTSLELLHNGRPERRRASEQPASDNVEEKANTLADVITCTAKAVGKPNPDGWQSFGWQSFLEWLRAELTEAMTEDRRQRELAESRARDMKHTCGFGADVMNKLVLPRVKRDAGIIANGNALELLERWLAERDTLRRQVETMKKLLGRVLHHGLREEPHGVGFTQSKAEREAGQLYDGIKSSISPVQDAEPLADTSKNAEGRTAGANPATGAGSFDLTCDACHTATDADHLRDGLCISCWKRRYVALELDRDTLKARCAELEKQLAESEGDYDELSRLLNKRFPKRPDGTLPDFTVEDVLRENNTLTLANELAEHLRQQAESRCAELEHQVLLLKNEKTVYQFGRNEGEGVMREINRQLRERCAELEQKLGVSRAEDWLVLKKRCVELERERESLCGQLNTAEGQRDALKNESLAFMTDLKLPEKLLPIYYQNQTVHACWHASLAQSLTLEQALVLMVEQLAEQNTNLFKEVIRLRSHAPVVLTETMPYDEHD